MLAEHGGLMTTTYAEVATVDRPNTCTYVEVASAAGA